LAGKKERLLNIFEGWCDNVIDLIVATDEEAILRRDIYDRVPVLSWGKGRVTLLGDSIHAMQPNMGQGGCMAIEVQSMEFNFCLMYPVAVKMFLLRAYYAGKRECFRGLTCALVACDLLFSNIIVFQFDLHNVAPI